MANLSTKLPWEKAQPLWAAQLNPLLSNPLNEVGFLQNISLVAGNNVINHGLGRQQQGWIITDILGEVTYPPYRNAPFNNLTLTLYSPSAVTISLGVF